MKIIAHRGNDNIHKENSLEAITNSLNSKYTDGVEFDIRFTKDYKFIVHHDFFYQGHFIKKTKAKVLRKKGLNTLEEILKTVTNDKIILIEIKEESKKYKYLVYKLIKILKKYPLNYYICSFNYHLIKYFHQKYPFFKTGLIIGPINNLKYIKNDFAFNSVYYKNIKKTIKETFAWTINKIEDIPKTDVNIITDKYKEIYTYLKKSF